jgi:arsenate reductase (thioredoxin)
MSQPSRAKITFYKPLEDTIRHLAGKFYAIPKERKEILKQLTDFIESKAQRHQKIELIFICTHNSRRSHISQLWAQAAASYFGIPDVVCYSGGTEATAFNPRAVKAMNDAGFRINATTAGNNPVYEIFFSDHAGKAIAFSKKYDSEPNPKKKFAAVMTCSHADENCPVVHGAEKRISLPYNDPKDFDGTLQEAAKYSERVMEIGTEILYAFSQVKIPATI